MVDCDFAVSIIVFRQEGNEAHKRNYTRTVDFVSPSLGLLCT
jgi:hypothetical protein